MSFARGVFIFALLMLLLGALGGHYLVSSLFAPAPEPSFSLAQNPTPPHKSTTKAHATTAELTASPTAGAASTALRTPGATTTTTATSTPVVTPSPSPTVTTTSTPTVGPTPSPTPGIVTLTRYWIGSLQARGGETIAVGYVIDNATGHGRRLMLGASLKSSRAPGWLGAAISDPSHDVVATVPPGISTHERFFTLPAGLKPGSYDVAWGLKDAATSASAALVASDGVLRVTH